MKSKRVYLKIGSLYKLHDRGEKVLNVDEL